MTARNARPYDLVVFGATSFVGEILCRYLVDRHGTDGDLAWAIAGRNADKLETVAASTGADVPRIVADAADGEALAIHGALAHHAAGVSGCSALVRSVQHMHVKYTPEA